ncbi:MAG: hypothetical protein ABI885_05115 [Gammaproteobacteria bacterium]
MNVVSDSMTIVDMVQAVPHLLSAIPFDDSSICVLAMLAGIIGGWTLTGMQQQLKGKRVKMNARKPQDGSARAGQRKPD